MKYPSLTLLFVLLAGGCATHRPAPTAKEIHNKREELEALCGELRLAALQLDHVQRDLSTNGVYAVTDQSRDLDYSILTVQQARDRLVAKYWKVVKEYHYDWKGSY
jgi:hypothetical protein